MLGSTGRTRQADVNTEDQRSNKTLELDQKTEGIQMRKIIVGTYLSLDGVTENPMWTMPYMNDEIAQDNFNGAMAADALLLGRVTYEGFAASWTTPKHEAWMNATFPLLPPSAFNKQMNSMKKYVVSRSVQELPWNNSHLIVEDVAEEIRKLKAQPGQDILVNGSGTLIQTLMEHDQIDEYSLIVVPIVLGNGKRLFEERDQPVKLKLLETKTYETGVMRLNYVPDRT
jgi:dihydrofolate reductase